MAYQRSKVYSSERSFLSSAALLGASSVSLLSEIKVSNRKNGSAFYMTDFRHLDHIISGVFIEPHLYIRSQKEWAMTNADVLCHAGVA